MADLLDDLLHDLSFGLALLLVEILFILGLLGFVRTEGRWEDSIPDTTRSLSFIVYIGYMK